MRLGLAGIHPRDRLVQEKRARPGGQGQGHAQGPLVTVGQASGQLVR